MTATGSYGELLVVHQRAALLGDWQLDTVETVGGPRFTITAEVKVLNEYWISQSPTLQLRVGTRLWCWEKVSLLVAEGRVTMRVRGRPSIRKDTTHG